MRVLLIAANNERTNVLPLPLGPACVAAACRAAGDEAALLDLMFESDPASAVRDRIAAFRPDVIGISVRNIDNQNMAGPRFLLPFVREVVDTCRSLSCAPIVLGGPGYSIFPVSALGYLGADMGIRGDGEAVFPALLERLGKGADVSGLPGLYLPGRPAPVTTYATRLEGLPLPEPELWIPRVADADELWIPVEGKRGCPMLCSFCSTKDIQGTRIRERSAETTVNWLAELAARGFRNFAIVDNTFNIPPSYAKEMCRAILRRGLDVNLWCIVYPKWVDRELVELMAESGCREVSLGFESGSDGVLESFNKKFDVEEVRAIAQLFREADIARTGFLMLGGPGETIETVEESLAFADSLQLESLKVTVGIRIYPETALQATAVAEGLIAPDDDLLQPTFYIAPQLKAWLPERAAAYKALRSWVV